LTRTGRGQPKEIFHRGTFLSSLGVTAKQAKLAAQRIYIAWRDSLGRHGGDRGNQYTGGKIASVQSCHPAADPGDVTAWRWRAHELRLGDARV
jgi:hypothetical protein